jgi:hypothetical protein
MNDHNPQVEVLDDQAAPVLHDVRHALFRRPLGRVGANLRSRSGDPADSGVRRSCHQQRAGVDELSAVD